MDRHHAADFVAALAAESGIVAVVGAGGKKSTLYRLLEAHRAIGTERLLLTSTVRTRGAPGSLELETVVIEDDDLDGAIARSKGRRGAFLFAGPEIKTGWFRGLSGELVPRLHEDGAFAVSLVKADGARMRMLKAPGEGEPALPGGVSTILSVVSARAFGRPLSESLIHRPERLAKIIDADEGAPLTPDHVARLLASPEGALRNIGQTRVVPVINMVDSPRRHDFASEAAAKALAMTDRFDRVVLAAMTQPSPLVDVVEN